MKIMTAMMMIPILTKKIVMMMTMIEMMMTIMVKMVLLVISLYPGQDLAGPSLSSSARRAQCRASQSLRPSPLSSSWNMTLVTGHMTLDR